jgi:urease accessory protein
MITDLALARLFQLVSPGLPIGAYSYSQGLEKAIEDAWLVDEATVAAWLRGQLDHGLAFVDVPIFARLYDAWSEQRLTDVEYWSEEVLAHRETAELRAQELQCGRALARVLRGLGVEAAQTWQQHPHASLVSSFALAAYTWAIPKQAAALGYVWSWLENQVLVAVKLVPLGQSAGQRLLNELALRIPTLVDAGLALPNDQIGGSTPGLALASCRHEEQYSRLFRS